MRRWKLPGEGREDEAGRIADVSLEYAHVSFARNTFDEAALKESIHLASKMIKRYERSAVHYSVCILVDDKHVRNQLTIDDTQPFLQLVSRQIRQVDYICFERRLTEYKEQMVEALRADKRMHVSRQMSRYEKAHGRIGCSHDIAIWHLMRLGVIGDVDVETVVPVGALRRSAPPFVARKAVSILSHDDREAEERAVREVLQYCRDETIVGRVERVYY